MACVVCCHAKDGGCAISYEHRADRCAHARAGVVAAAHLHVELQLLEVFVVVGEHVDEADLLARLAAGLLGGRRGCARARLRGRGKRVAAGHVGDACHVHRV